MNKIISITENDKWNSIQKPFFTIITPLYNRKDTIQRTMISVAKQTNRDFEYIVIDDGSSDLGDEIVFSFMNITSIPMTYIKKDNGGVHSARNVGYEYARGVFVICIDSDDELLPDACQIFYEAWQSIPEDRKKNYWQIKALCIDEEGEIVTSKFPDNINEISLTESAKLFSLGNGEQLGCRLLSIMKKNKFPEPREVKFVDENILWTKLEKEYCSWGVNKSVRIYHADADNRLTGGGTKSVQSCKNALWNCAYYLQHSNLLIRNEREYAFTVFRYLIMKKVIKKKEKGFVNNCKIRGVKNYTYMFLLNIPAIFGSLIYKKKRIISN